MSGPQALLTNKYATPVSNDQQRFVIRNRVATSFKGPVFAVEDVWVPCSRCHTPVDPVMRIPVGHQWFHPHCLRCSLCSCPSKTNVFHAVRGQPVCADCSNKGHAKFVRPPTRQTTSSQGSRTPFSIAGSPSPGRDPMLLTISSQQQDPRAATRKQLELMTRQDAMLHNDQNILLLTSPPPPPSRERLT